MVYIIDISIVSGCNWAITWTNIDPDLWCHMASVGHNELNVTEHELKVFHKA